MPKKTVENSGDEMRIMPQGSGSRIARHDDIIYDKMSEEELNTSVYARRNERALDDVWDDEV